ncbi:MAG: NAD(+)/NADH kinase [Clostridiales bacterium]|nr:NAD(+)/NADH kinase [Clostridiales bacterium]
MLKLSLILNYKNEETAARAAAIRSFLRDKPVLLDAPPDKPGYSLEDCEGRDFRGTDAALVLGGDGTLLAACRHLSPQYVPMLSINMGKLGFLAEVEKDQVFWALEKLLTGEYFIEERGMIEGRVVRKGEETAKVCVLNDLVVNNGDLSRSLVLQLSAGGELVYSYRGDGLIVSTPTGSTAYSFSAGGPIVTPQLNIMIVTPICPHNLFNRSIILDSANGLEIVCRSAGEACRLTADGQYRYPLEKDDRLLIGAAQTKALLVRLREVKFFATLHNKLKTAWEQNLPQ